MPEGDAAVEEGTACEDTDWVFVGEERVGDVVDGLAELRAVDVRLVDVIRVEAPPAIVPRLPDASRTPCMAPGMKWKVMFPSPQQDLNESTSEQ